MWRSTHRRLLQRLGRRTSGGISRCRSILPRETPLWPSLLIRVTGTYPLAALAYTACGCVGSPKASFEVSQGSVAVHHKLWNALDARVTAGPGAGETAGAAWHIGRPNLQRKVTESANVSSALHATALAELLSTRILICIPGIPGIPRPAWLCQALCSSLLAAPEGRSKAEACSLARLQASTISENSWNLPASSEFLRKTAGLLRSELRSEPAHRSRKCKRLLAAGPPHAQNDGSAAPRSSDLPGAPCHWRPRDRQDPGGCLDRFKRPVLRRWTFPDGRLKQGAPKQSRAVRSGKAKQTSRTLVVGPEVRPNCLAEDSRTVTDLKTTTRLWHV